MQDRFFAKTWIQLAQVIALGPIGLICVPLGIASWTGALLDAQNRPATDAGPPMVIIGTVLLLVAAMALIRVIAGLKPLIRVYREGIVVNLTGATALDGIPLLGRIGRLLIVLWSILSLQGFKSVTLQLPWGSIDNITCQGPSFGRLLVIQMAPMKIAGINRSLLAFHQAFFTDNTDEAAGILAAYLAQIEERMRLPSWGAATVFPPPPR
jgi:hypothetical protein